MYLLVFCDTILLTSCGNDVGVWKPGKAAFNIVGRIFPDLDIQVGGRLNILNRPHYTAL